MIVKDEVDIMQIESLLKIISLRMLGIVQMQVVGCENINITKILKLLIEFFPMLKKSEETPTANERAEKLLVWLENANKYLGQKIQIISSEKSLFSVCWAMNNEEFQFLLKYLLDRNFLNCVTYSGRLLPPYLDFTITTSGLAYLDALRKNIQSNIGFCAMSFG